jgi:hypothetical protein
MSAVRLTVVHDDLEAEVLCGHLRSNGIACTHRWTDVAAGAWVGAGMAGPTEILVSDTDLEAARKLLPPEEPRPSY